MPNWFDFNGVRSTTNGVYVQTYPPATIPEERAQFEPIPGRSGSLTLLEGDAVYDDVILSIDCFVRDLTNLDAIAAWLRGSGDLVLGNMPNRCYKARCVNQIELAKVLRGRQHRSFAAVFRCAPYRYAYPTPAALTITASPGSITNPGTADAAPVITVVGSGDITLTIGAKTITITGLASAITIDCDAGVSVNGATDLTGTVTMDYPVTLPPGETAISWTGTVTSVTIAPKWRYV